MKPTVIGNGTCKTVYMLTIYRRDWYFNIPNSFTWNIVPVKFIHIKICKLQDLIINEFRMILSHSIYYHITIIDPKKKIEERCIGVFIIAAKEVRKPKEND